MAEIIYLSDYQHRRRAELERLYRMDIDKMTDRDWTLFMEMERRREYVLAEFFAGENNGDRK